MNPDPPMKRMPDDRPIAQVGGQGALDLMRRLLGASGGTGSRRGKRDYPDAVPGSADPTRRRRVPYVNAEGHVEHMPASGPGTVTRWRSEKGTLHRRRREAGDQARLVTVER